MFFLPAACAVDGGTPGDPGADDDAANGTSIEVREVAPRAGVLPATPTQHPRIYLTPNRARLRATLSAGTPAANRFRSTVDQWLGGADIWGFASWNGALLSQLTGNPAYCKKSIAEVEAQVAAAEAASAAGRRPEVASDSYLGVGEMIGDVGLVYDWCFSQVTASQRARWIAYANQAVWNVWHPTQARWGNTAQPWSGWSVNNPSNNYYYSFLRATMLLGLATRGENAQAEQWLTTFHDEKILGQLVPTFDADLVGGGSREGTGYGVAMRRLYELYQLWKSTTGEDLATRTVHTRASMLAFMHQTLPTLDRVAPTGDHARDATAAFFDYHRDYLQELMAIFPSDHLAKRAKSLIGASSVPAMTSSFMYAYDFLDDPTEIPALPLDGLATTYHAKGIGELYARSGWDAGATWVNLIAGPYTESHAHQDQGSLMIYKGGWLAYDANVKSKSGLSQATTSHSLVRINRGSAPVRQVVSTESKLAALKKGAGYVYASADLTPAYNGDSAVQKVHREMLYLEPNIVVVFDRVQTASDTTQTWQLATPVAPSISGSTATISNAGHTLRVMRIAPSGGAMSVYDYRADQDMSGGYRIDEPMTGGDRRYLHVLAMDGSVASASANGDTGVTLSLAGGGTVVVRFVRDTVGATLTRNGVTTALVAGVETLPE
ncbi:MAG TPA: hypothetical protein VN253_06485 [Kofleriaceae bacterium]|nr:hypothetical protein [Kofleriaceae bacterium]